MGYMSVTLGALLLTRQSSPILMLARIFHATLGSADVQVTDESMAVLVKAVDQLPRFSSHASKVSYSLSGSTGLLM